MVEQRKDRRAPASLKVKYKSSSIDQFVEQFSVDVSDGGIFLKTKSPIEVGALLKLELQLSDASPVLHGTGRVCWRRMPGPDPNLPAGMGIRFVTLAPESRAVVERMVQSRGARASRFEQTTGAELEENPEGVAAAQLDTRTELGGMPNLAPNILSQAPSPASSAPPAKAPVLSAPPPVTLPPRPPETPARTAAHEPPPSPAMAKPAGLFADNPIARSVEPEARVPGSAHDSFFPPVPENNPPAPASASTAPLATPTPAGAHSSASSSNPPKRPSFSSAPPNASTPAATLAGPVAISDAPEPGSEAEFGEAELSDPTSVPLSKSVTGADAEPPKKVAVSVPPMAHSALQEFGTSKRPSALVWIMLCLIGGAAGAGYFFYDAQQAAEAAAAAEKAATAETERAATAEAARIQAANAAAAAQAQAATGDAAVGTTPAGTQPVAGAAAQSVQVDVSSVPRGAEVLIDGNLGGTTPTRLTLPLGRTAKITVRSVGFASATKTVTASEHIEAQNFELSPLPYAVTVRSEPPGALLEIGTRSVIAPGPLQLGHLEGDAQVSVSKPGFQRVSRPVQLSEFSEHEGVMRAEIAVSLSRLPSSQSASHAQKGKKPTGKGAEATAEGVTQTAAPAETAAPTAPSVVAPKAPETAPAAAAPVPPPRAPTPPTPPTPPTRPTPPTPM